MSKKILIVDNHPVILKFMKDLLEKEGHELRTAEDGLLALGVLESFTPDVMFIDLVMPNINGEKLCQIALKMPRLKHTKLVILSAIAAEEDQRCTLYGAHACIAKGPFDVMAKNILAVLEQFRNDTQESAGVVLGLENVYPREITKELLSIKRHFEIILASIAEGMLELTADGQVVYANPSALEILGVPEEKLLGSHFLGFFRGDDQPMVADLMSQSLHGPQRSPDDLPFRVNDKQVLLNIQPVKDGNGRTIVIMTDVSERKMMRFRLQHAQKMESIGTLTGGLAHNFDDILTAILGHISLAKLHAREGEKVYQKLEETEKIALEARDLTQHLATLSRDSAPVKRTVSLKNVIIDSAIFALSGTDAKYEFDIPDDLWQVNIDEGQIIHVITNIIANAEEAMPEGGGIRVRASNKRLDSSAGSDYQATNYVKIEIEDEGIGMPADSISKIFDPYYTTKENRKGLGLATAYAIIHQHGGCITVNSEMGVGTTFSIYLPAAREVANG